MEERAVKPCQPAGQSDSVQSSPAQPNHRSTKAKSEAIVILSEEKSLESTFTKTRRKKKKEKKLAPIAVPSYPMFFFLSQL